MELINVKNNSSITLFNGEKYNIWKSRVRALIDESIIDHNALSIIDCANCPDDIDPNDWLLWNKVAKGIIIRSLGDSVVSYATNDPTISARGIFLKLDEIYSRRSIATELSMEMKLQALKYDTTNALSHHFMIFDELVADMEAASGDRLKESNKIARLLSTLPKSFNALVVAIQTLNDKDLNLAFVKTRLLDHEVQINNEVNDTSSTVLHVNKYNVTNKSANTYKMKTKNFNTHKMNNRNKYSNNMRRPFNNNNNNNSKKENSKCHHCGRKGHYINDCFYYKRIKQQQQSTENRIAQTANKEREETGFAFMIGHKILNAENKIKFILDSGASDHLINNINMFDECVNLNPPIKISTAKNNAYITATKKGVIKLFTNTNTPIVLKDVLYCEEVPHNLLSVRKIQAAGMSVHFNKYNGISINKGGKVIIMQRFINNLPLIEFKTNCKTYTANTINSNQYNLWHQRLGHIGKAKFAEIKNNRMFLDIEKINNIKPSNEICEACLQGKQSRLKYGEKKKEHVKRPLFIIHTDVCGPVTPTTINDKKYYVIFVDQFTHYCVTYLLGKKSDAFEMFKDFANKSEAHFNTKIVNLYCDNGREYLSNEMKEFCVQKGITYHLTVPHSPQQNGVSERMIRTLTEKARAMVHFAKLDKTFWGEAVLTATYLVNRSPSNALLKVKKTPYELWHNKKPELKYLKVFGATVYVHNKTRSDKFEEKSWKGILVGYVPNGYKVWCVETAKFETARDVVVDEINFIESRPSEKSDEVQLRTEKIIREIIEEKSDERLEKMVEENVESYPTRNEDEEEKSLSCESDHEKENDNEPRRSKRIKMLPPISYKSFDKYLLSAESLINDVPDNFDDIKFRNDKHQWEQAIKDELDSHEENQTWHIVSKPKDKNIVDSKWVFTIKNDEYGNPSRYKARLVAKGFTQQYLTDYDETYAPVARINSFRFILAFANQYKLLVHHMDVKTAFLNGILKEEIYMKIPEGLNKNDQVVCKLNKAIYGLKQAARCWFEVFNTAMVEKGFINSEVDRCIYTLDNGDVNKNIYVLLYVDDLVIVTECSHVLSEFKQYLNSKFQMKDLGEIKYFIGIKIDRTNNKFCLSQSAYIRTVLEKYNMSECKPVSSPLPNKLDYEALNSEEEYDAPCRNVIGCLMYIMICTRPDLSTCVNILSRYSSKNNKELWQNLKRVLRYLKGTIDLKLVFETNNNDKKEMLIGYVDSDWGGNDINDRKSTTGYLFKIFEKSTISWNTRRQLSVATSSTEAEYMALFEAVKEAIWLKALAKSIHIDIQEQIKIFEDNQGCINIANNPACHKKTKHISIKYHYTREQIENKIIKLEYISTDNQLADVLTKPLAAIRFINLRRQIGLQE